MDYKKNNSIADRIRSDKYRIFNKELAHYIGLNESIYLSYLIDQDHYFNENKMGKPFYKQQYYIYYETTLKEDTIRRLNKKFIEMKLLTIKKQGLPAKNYFIINYDVVEKLLEEAEDNFIKVKTEYLEAIKKGEEVESSTGNLPEQSQAKNGDKNNKEENNKETFINSKEFIKGEHENGSLNAEGNLDNNYLEELGKEIGSEGIDLFSKKEGSQEVSEDAAPTAEEKKKQKGGLGPLYDMITIKYPTAMYPTVNAGLKTYLKRHIGLRRLPSKEKWQEMLDKLYELASIELPGSFGKKFIEGKAIPILEKAIEGKDGVPYPDFDNIFDGGLMEPTVQTNQSNLKGY